MTKLGLGSYALAWSVGVAGYAAPARPMDAAGLLDYASQSGVHLVQIADNLPLDALTESDRDALAKKARELGVAVEVGTRGIAPQHLRQYLHVAQQFGSSILRVVVDTQTDHPEPATIVTTLTALVPEFEQAGITLAIENHDRFTAATLAGVIRAIDSPFVGICLDTVNSFGSLEGPQVILAALAPYVVNLHIKDFTIRRLDHNMGFVISGTPAGAGLLDIPWLLATLRQHGRDFNAILELWPAPESSMAATIAKEQAWVEQSIHYLRQYIQD